MPIPIKTDSAIKEMNASKDFHENGAPKIDGVCLLVIYDHECGACKHFMPVFEQLAKSKNASHFKCARVANSGTSKDLMNKLKIKYFPTIMLFKNGVYHGEYTSDRTIDALTRFASSVM